MSARTRLETGIDRGWPLPPSDARAVLDALAAAEAALADCAEIAGAPYLGPQGLAGAVRLCVARANERADAAEAECARLREERDYLRGWRETADGLMVSIERIASVRDTARAEVTRAEAAVLAALTERDTARAEADALRAIVEGRTVAPDDATIAAHAAAGGCWLLAWSDGAVSRVRGRASVEDAREAGVCAVVRWWPLDATGRPCAWPTTGGGL